MTQRKLETIVRLWQRRLGLGTWELEIDFETPAADSHLAEMSQSRDYDEGTLRLESEWQKWPTRKAHQVVVHELLHVVLRDLELYEVLLEGQLHRDVDSVVRRAHKHHLEQAVDRLAYRFVELAGVA